MNDKKITSSMTDTLKKSDLTIIAANFSELALDSLLGAGEDLLKKAPIFGTIVNLIKAGYSIRDHIFIKKLYSFLSALNDIEPEIREEAIKRLEADPKYSKKVGENLIILLERLDDYEKPKLLANVFKAYCNKKISILEMQRLNYAVDRVMTCDLPEMKTFLDLSEGESLDQAVEQNFLNCGLGCITSAYGSNPVRPTELCGLFAKYALEIEQ